METELKSALKEVKNRRSKLYKKIIAMQDSDHDCRLGDPDDACRLCYQLDEWLMAIGYKPRKHQF